MSTDAGQGEDGGQLRRLGSCQGRFGKVTCTGVVVSRCFFNGDRKHNRVDGDLVDEDFPVCGQGAPRVVGGLGTFDPSQLTLAQALDVLSGRYPDDGEKSRLVNEYVEGQGWFFRSLPSSERPTVPVRIVIRWKIRRNDRELITGDVG